MPLTDTAIKNLKATGKVHKHFDGGGLYVHVSPTGSKLWRQFYRFDGKVKTLSYGAYPVVSLKMARDLRDQAKALLARGSDPSGHK
ncbi:MAG: Arm DNA-binding domain-containing protein, partial [Planctomycetes bacterium]|nr:Arm DNA-binding domain-containing protein [Planctomycetota bacterium]